MSKPKADEAEQGVQFAPASVPFVLSSGRPCQLLQPDQFALASGEIDIPNDAKRDIWELLLRYRTTPGPNEQLLADERWVRAHFYMAQLVLVPRLKLDEDDQEGVIDRRELSLPDLLAIYDFWRFGPPKPAENNDAGASGNALPSLGDGQSAE